MKVRNGFLFWSIFAVIVVIGGGFFASSWARETRKSGPGNVGFSAGVQVKAQVQKPMVREEILRFLSQQPNAYPQKWVETDGIAAADADLSSKKVWLTAIDGPKNDAATAGFFSVKIKNSSSQPWSGVTIAADIDVSYAEGIAPVSDFIAVIVFEDGRNISQPTNSCRLSGTGQYHLTSYPFTMNPGREYQARVVMAIFPKYGYAKGAVAVISDIKWTI
jgi:hypothetical protein